MDLQGLAGRLNSAVINPLLLLLFAVGLLVFVYGVVEYMYEINVRGGTKGESADQGRMHMLWGVIGMFIMVAAYAIVAMIGRFIGVSVPGA